MLLRAQGGTPRTGFSEEKHRSQVQLEGSPSFVPFTSYCRTYVVLGLDGAWIVPNVMEMLFVHKPCLECPLSCTNFNSFILSNYNKIKTPPCEFNCNSLGDTYGCLLTGKFCKGCPILFIGFSGTVSIKIANWSLQWSWIHNTWQHDTFSYFL